MNPVSEVTSAAKSAFSIKTMVVALVSFVVLAAIFDAAGKSQWLLQPFTAAKNKFGKKA